MPISTITWLADKLMQRGRDNKATLREKWDRVADYFDQIANCLEKMVLKFKNKEIPTVEGNELHMLILHFPSVVESIYSKEDSQDKEQVDKMLDELCWTAHRAANTDYIYATARYFKEKSMEYKSPGINPTKWIREMERTAGRFRGLAAALRASTP